MRYVKHCPMWLPLLLSILDGLSCNSPTESSGGVYTYSFESGMDEWRTRALDVTMNLPDTTITIPWHILQSNARASRGTKSLEFYFQNSTDAAKIWIERTFIVTSGKPYTVTVTYDFASADGGAVGGQTLVTRITAVSPDSSSQIIAGAIGGTYNGGGFEYRWIKKRVDSEIVPTSPGQIYVVIGVWGTFEIESTYYIDNVQVQIVPK